MKHTLLVTPSELEDFADRMDTAGIIPELINLLVRTSVSDLTVCRIPYRDSIGLPGPRRACRDRIGLWRVRPEAYQSVGDWPRCGRPDEGDQRI